MDDVRTPVAVGAANRQEEHIRDGAGLIIP